MPSSGCLPCPAVPGLRALGYPRRCPPRVTQSPWAAGDGTQGSPVQGRAWGGAAPPSPEPLGLGQPLPGAPGRALSLLVAAPLNTGVLVCSNSINKNSSGHRESLVFTVNSASKQRHRFVFYSLTPFIIPCFNRLPPGLRDAFFYSRLFPITRCASLQSLLLLKHTRGCRG